MDMRIDRLRMALCITAVSVALGLGTTAALAATLGTQPAARMIGPLPTPPISCAPPALPGSIVDVSVTDIGAMMAPGMMGRGMMVYGPGTPGRDGYPWPAMRMMRIAVAPASAPAGQISLRVANRGVVAHEVVVLPLNANQNPGQREMGSDWKVDEAGSLGEASRTCGADRGDGIASGASGWTTLILAPGRYELLCNIPGHYRAGMFTELDVLPNG